MTSTRRVLITGSRDFTDRSLMDSVLGEHVGANDVLIHGDARGADRMADDWAKRHGVTIEVYPADWDRYGRSAGFKRNEQMINTGPDLVLAFYQPGAANRGTQMAVDMAAVKHITTLRFTAATA